MVRAFQGFVKYFPDAIAAVALLSKIANDQHNPGQPIHWAKEKSKDELDSLMNHLLDIASKGELSRDADDVLDAVKVAWRGMANLQRLIDKHGIEVVFPHEVDNTGDYVDGVDWTPRDRKLLDKYIKRLNENYGGDLIRDEE